MYIFGETDKGKIRKKNQDYYTNRVISSDLGYSIVCDGMGGAEGGEIASKMAAEYIDHALFENLSSDLADGQLMDLLTQSVKNANSEIYNYSIDKENLRGMGTTVVAIIVKNNKIFGISDGDTRLYKINKITHEINQITKDHTFVQILVEKGQITKEQALTHPKKHIITRALGVEEAIDTDSFKTDIQNNEIILICSDGLYNYMDEQSLIKKTIDSAKIGTVKPLIDLANENGGGDNITAVILTGGAVNG